MITPVAQQPWDGRYANGSVLTTTHYRIFTTSVNRTMTTYFPGFMEASYRNYLRLTGLPDKPLDAREKMLVYMMGSRQEWADMTRNVTGETAELYLSIESGGFCHEGIGVFWDIGGLGTFSVAAHEGLHQFFRHRLRQHLPMWMEEGICAVAEGYQTDDDAVLFTPSWNHQRFTDLRSCLANNRWRPLEQLLPMDAGDVVTEGTERAVEYYGQLWALSLFLQSDPAYARGLRRMLTDAQDGTMLASMPVAALAYGVQGKGYNRAASIPLFRKYIADDLAAFEIRFQAFARHLAKLR